ncbi:MAG: squalene/phytoene synthase family protein [Hyphomicrobiaceae bacterium]|nr:squalene/phytoene synthase family protein [Hyphomicrobiaceae bacterium]
MNDSAQSVVVTSAARENAHELYLSALLAPRDKRADLIALAAFEGELNRVAVAVSEAIHGEFRLQWWRDLIEERSDAASSGNPIADALRDVVVRHRISREGLRASIDARSAELDPGEVTSLPAFFAYLDMADGAALARAARVLLGRAPMRAENAFLEPAGRAVALARLAYQSVLGHPPAVRLVSDLERRCVIPRQMPSQRAGAWLVDEARRQLLAAREVISVQTSATRRSALPLALVEPQLHVWEGYDPSTGNGPRPILPLSRVWRLWRLARLGRM